MEATAKQAQQLTSEISTPADSINFQNRRHVERKNQRYEQTRCWCCNGKITERPSVVSELKSVENVME